VLIDSNNRVLGVTQDEATTDSNPMRKEKSPGKLVTATFLVALIVATSGWIYLIFKFCAAVINAL
jgi:hypothetical protein